MKNMKKLVGIFMLTMALLVSMVIPTFAANITVDGGAAGAEYAAFKLLDATDGGDGKFAYTLNETYDEILAEETGMTELGDIVAYITALDAEGIKTFAANVYEAITAAGITADYTSDANVFANVAQGYYLIAETKLGNTADTYSLVMLDTQGDEDITVSTKEDIPSLEKEVEEKNDTTGATAWGESADYDIGDSIPYRLTGTVSDKYADYKSYYYSFVDTMVKGLSFNNDAVVTIDGVDVTEQFTIVETEDGFTATANLKEITGVDINADSVIVVEYTCTLTDDAVVGAEGNENEAYIEYENNPNHEADGNPDTPDKPGDDTPDDDEDGPSKSEKEVAIVFTFEAIVNKVNDKGALAGAGFTLYKNVEGTWTEVKKIEAGETTTFNFKGLDAGEYKLEETTVPDGYNKCEDILFEVVAEYDVTKEPAELTDLKVMNGEEEVESFTVDVTAGTVTTDVLNVSGSELPSTGGIGRTIFYVAGGVVFVAALVLLITKKRMSAEK
ncbi:MAG: isopeptide-forming domain-containing fimbrial protein [Ruminococcaceae bacterium]|nr:isopeptide-forming domain-containing fimbrial protein [Oscillospiraceae bacterium]